MCRRCANWRKEGKALAVSHPANPLRSGTLPHQSTAPFASSQKLRSALSLRATVGRSQGWLQRRRRQRRRRFASGLGLAPLEQPLDDKLPIGVRDPPELDRGAVGCRAITPIIAFTAAAIACRLSSLRQRRFRSGAHRRARVDQKVCNLSRRVDKQVNVERRDDESSILGIFSTLTTKQRRNIPWSGCRG